MGASVASACNRRSIRPARCGHAIQKRAMNLPAARYFSRMVRLNCKGRSLWQRLSPWTVCSGRYNRLSTVFGLAPTHS
jgi:hypothetical protein